jgi:signal transduction histidine kinase
MRSEKALSKIRWKDPPLAAVLFTTLVALAVAFFCLSSGHFIIFQNLFYIPIIIACLYYLKRGFFFSVIVAIGYFCLIAAFTQSPVLLFQAGIRVSIFILVAGVTTYLASIHSKTEDLLRSQRELLSEMTAQVPGVVYQFYARPNGEKGLYYVSSRSEQIFGLKPDPAHFFEKFTSMVIPEEREDFLNSIERAVRDVSEWRYEGVLEKPSHERIWFSGNSIPSLRQGNEVVFNGILIDVTGRKAMEAEKRRLEDLKSSAEVKSKFTAIVSHELRSPLAVVKEALDILSEGMVGNINDEQKEVVSMAKSNIDRLSRLINSVLDFQKIQSGKMEFDIRENDLGVTLTEAAEGLSILSKRGELGFKVECDPGLSQVKFDRDKISQVLTNLVSNAFSNTENGGVTLRAQREPTRVHVSVRDTGRGIQADDLERVFEPFEQAGKSGKKKGGSGLGLAISREIVQAHHGEIWVESELGKGSTFHFTLPL